MNWDISEQFLHWISGDTIGSQVPFSEQNRLIVPEILNFFMNVKAGSCFTIFNLMNDFLVRWIDIMFIFNSFCSEIGILRRFPANIMLIIEIVWTPILCCEQDTRMNEMLRKGKWWKPGNTWDKFRCRHRTYSCRSFGGGASIFYRIKWKFKEEKRSRFDLHLQLDQSCSK